MSSTCAIATQPYRPHKVGYLVRVSPKGHASGMTHIWDGHDTACRMWSTGGLNQAKNWEYHVSPATHLCMNCTRNFARTLGFEPTADGNCMAPFTHVGEHFHKARKAFVEVGGDLDECPF